ncbi:uncharacterized protein B0I36DRAFT_343745 [Microdochium trichocladiopsis]|uniref:Uncharacterized protein n=1 Tax=Microdochium trichocladiopsis TaxID=1682393 RepID=A0A9P8YGL6_9PEZI|nr:uncharacterized protein B0I36DRAFT_343745 [Microdochium trichocladiopsis]KAH7039920.1 hypothetical protein B0I36DRAFT_343745 [Microdochium trichocladiopsis]
MTEYRIKTTASGRPRFVRSQSYSHPRHHHLRHHLPHLHHDHSDGLDHHHLVDHLFPHDHYYHVEYRRGQHHHQQRPKCPTDCACITRDEWANLLKQNRHYVVLAGSLQEEISKLKKKVEAAADAKAAADKENQKLLGSNAELAAAVRKLQEENAELRRCLAAHKEGDSSLIESLRRRIRDQLIELDGKNAFIRNLESRIDDLKKEIFGMKHRYKHRHDYHQHHHHSSCRCRSCRKKEDKKAGTDGGGGDSSSDDQSGGDRKPSRSYLKRKIGELEVSVGLWQHKAEFAEKRSRELQARSCGRRRSRIVFVTAYTGLKIGSAVARGVFGLLDFGWEVYCKLKELEEEVGEREREHADSSVDADADTDNGPAHAVEDDGSVVWSDTDDAGADD